MGNSVSTVEEDKYGISMKDVNALKDSSSKGSFASNLLQTFVPSFLMRTGIPTRTNACVILVILSLDTSVFVRECHLNIFAIDVRTAHIQLGNLESVSANQAFI